MYVIHCQNCSEDYQAHDRRKSDTIRCPLCRRVIQAGNVKREVVKIVNRVDDHEKRITCIERTRPTQQYIIPQQIPPVQYVSTPPVQYVHAPQCCCPACMTSATASAIVVLVGFVAFVGFIVWLFNV